VDRRNVHQQGQDARRVRPGEKLAFLEWQYEEVHAMKDRSEKRKNK
jgi:hypothetical protein